MFSMVFPFSEIVKEPQGEAALRTAMSLAFLNGGLPQGTPISPLITNVMMIPVDFKLSNTLRNFEKQSFIYTRYADDFIISSKYDFDVRSVEELVVSTLNSFGAPFTINASKTRYGSSAGRNWNLGVMLNKDNEITVGHKKKKQIKEMVNGSAYDFLRTNEHLGRKIIFLTLGGSYSYGTNVETSDVDVRGCALNSESDLLGLTSFEQVVNTQTDTTIYAFNKLVSLLLNCNPNTIEMLGCKPEHYFYISDIGREMIANRKMFLSKRAVHSFGGYANQQLRRLENALARDRLSQARREEHILNSMKGAVKSFESRYTIFENGSIVLYTDESPREDLDREIFADIQLKKYPVREFNSVINDLTNVIGTYEKLNHRNHKKDDEHLNKHAMHLIRLYLLCLDILEKEDIVTYRGDDLPLLMSIRKGDYQLEDGTYRPEFFEMVSDFEKRLNYAKQNTSLPDNPDMKKVEEFVMSVNRRAIDA